MIEALSVRDPLVLGPFRLLGRLGTGGMGRVYLGRGPSGELVAVKMMHTRIADDPGFRSRFTTEVALARKVDSTGVARLVDADANAPLPWLAMEYLRAPSLEAAVGSTGPLDGPSCGVLARCLAEACADLHASKVAHRDLKPSNVLLAEDRPKLIDFGIARAVDATSATQTGVVLGPPGFMSPEQALGDDPGLPSDVFSLAAVLVYAATGRGPFGDASNAVAMMRRIVDDKPDLSDVPSRLRQLLEPCFAKDPLARPTAAALADQLAHHGSGPWPPAVVRHLIDEAGHATASIPAPPPPGPTPLTRREILAGVGFGIGLLGLGGTTIVLPSSPAGSSDPRTPMWEVRADGRVGTLLVTGDTLYAATQTRLYAVDPESGSVRWRIELKQAANLSANALDTIVYAGLPGRLTALDRETGRMLWEYSFDGASHQPSIATADGETVFATTPGQLAALEGLGGAVRWTQQIPDGHVTAVQGFDAGCVLATMAHLSAIDASSGQALWRQPFAPDHKGTRHADVELSVSAGVAVVSAGNILTGFDAATGARLWQAYAEPAATESRRMVVSGATVAVLGADGRVHALGLRTGSELWAHPMIRGLELDSLATDGVSVFASGRLALRILALDLLTGASRGNATPWSADLLGARDGVIYGGTPPGFVALKVRES